MGAKTLLDQASKFAPNEPIVLTRKIIFKADTHEDTTSDLNQLMQICADSRQEAASQNTKELAQIIQIIYGPLQANTKALPPEFRQILEKNLADGWYRERALLNAYKLTGQNQNYLSTVAEIENRSRNFLIKLVGLAITIAILGLIGLAVILWQLFHFKSMANSIRQSPAKSVKYGWPSVLAVFVGWILTQVLVGLASLSLRKQLFATALPGSNSSVIAAVVTAMYFFCSAPSLFYIYFFALQAHGTALLDGINFKLKAGNRGLLTLVGWGLLAWCAAIPLVLLAFVISTKIFENPGSSNPIIAIIMEAAHRYDFAAVILFYLTLGVLAPFFEESLFRGFFYNFLRSRYGVVFSNLLSAAVFACAHLDPGAVLPLFCLGSIFAYLFEVTDSTVPSIVAHGLWNSSTFTLILLLFSA